MTDWSDETRHQLSVAINDSTVLDVNVDVANRQAEVMLRVLTLPEDGSARQDTKVLLILSRVCRIAARLRHGISPDEKAAIVDVFDMKEMSKVVRSFNGCDVYGWRFCDLGNAYFEKCADRLSLDLESGFDGQAHTIDLFQDGREKQQNRDLVFRIWFDEMTVCTAEREEVDIEAFLEAAGRFWNGLRNGDPRVNDMTAVLPNGA